MAYMENGKKREKVNEKEERFIDKRGVLCYNQNQEKEVLFSIVF